MCKATERAQRRHRPAYIAPSAGPLHHHHLFGLPHHGTTDDINNNNHNDQMIPLLVEVPSESTTLVSPPSSGPVSESLDLSSIISSSPSPLSSSSSPQPLSLSSIWEMFWNTIISAYHWLVDAILLVVVCIIGCFFYDVEVRVVKSHRRHGGGGRHRGRSGRVVIEGTTTNMSRTSPLLRSPTRSSGRRGRGGSGSTHSRRSRGSWEV